MASVLLVRGGRGTPLSREDVCAIEPADTNSLLAELLVADEILLETTLCPRHARAMRMFPALLITATLCCITGAVQGQSVFLREASKGKLTLDNIVVPYDLAERATFCLDAMQKAKVDDATATQNWRAAESVAKWWAAYYGGTSLFGLTERNAGTVVNGAYVVGEPLLASCRADLAFAQAHLMRLSKETYAANWRTANSANRAQRTTMKVDQIRKPALNGWCNAVLDEALLKLRGQPTIFGYDVLNDAEVASRVRAIDARLWKAQRAWQETAKDFNSFSDSRALAAARNAFGATRSDLVAAKVSPEIRDSMLGQWLATEADLCVRGTPGNGSGVAIPPV